MKNLLQGVDCRIQLDYVPKGARLIMRMLWVPAVNLSASERQVIYCELVISFAVYLHTYPDDDILTG